MASNPPDLPLAVVGCDFRVASSRWRSRLVLDESQARAIADKLKSNQAADGFVDLNTCNRNEWIVSCPDPRWAAELLRAQMMQRAGPDARSWISPYLFTGSDAARHIFRVAIGQESLVVGERQIASQIYQALEIARQRETSSRILNGLGSVAGRLVRIALRRGCIENAAVGVHSLALAYLRNRLPGGPDARVAVIGLGRIGRRIIGQIEQDPHLQALGCNRTVPDDGSGNVCPLSELESVLDQADAAIVCTGALQPVVTGRHLRARPAGRPLLLIDIGIPQQVRLVEIPDNVSLAGLDQLTTFHHGQSVEIQADKHQEARGLVQRAVEEFEAFCSQGTFSGILDTIQKHHRQLVGEEIPRLIAKRLDYLPQAARSRLALDLKNIVLEYTSEVFRTIKDTSRRSGEDEKCQEE